MSAGRESGGKGNCDVATDVLIGKMTAIFRRET